MVATGNYDEAVIEHINNGKVVRQRLTFSHRCRYSGTLLVVDRQMSYMRQQLFPPACSVVTRTTIASEEARCE